MPRKILPIPSSPPWEVAAAIHASPHFVWAAVRGRLEFRAPARRPTDHAAGRQRPTGPSVASGELLKKLLFSLSDRESLATFSADAVDRGHQSPADLVTVHAPPALSSSCGPEVRAYRVSCAKPGIVESMTGRRRRPAPTKPTAQPGKNHLPRRPSRTHRSHRAPGPGPQRARWQEWQREPHRWKSSRSRARLAEASNPHDRVRASHRRSSRRASYRSAITASRASAGTQTAGLSKIVWCHKASRSRVPGGCSSNSQL